MNNEYHIELDGLKVEEPLYYLAYIIDYKKTSGNGEQVKRTSANGKFNADISKEISYFFSKPYFFPKKSRQSLAFLKFQGREYRYHQGKFEMLYFSNEAHLNPISTPSETNQMLRTPFWDFKLYVYSPISELKTPVIGHGIAIYNENGSLTYLKGGTDLVYAEDLRFGDIGRDRLYHSHSYELAGNIKKFYATSSVGDLVRAEACNDNVEPTYYKLDVPILSIKAPTEADENLIKSQGRYLIYR